MSLNFEKELDKAVRFHGHLCPGQIIGVRMALAGLREIGVIDPQGRQRKDLLVYVENDRCAADAIQSVTGCRLGKRSLKFYDYGKMATTFVNLKTGEAVRIFCPESSRELVERYTPPNIDDEKEKAVAAYKAMPEDEILTIQPVQMDIPPEDLPGKPRSRLPCQRCGEGIYDKREMKVEGKILCRACAQGAYYYLKKS